ncbi:MAG: hypothetical protein WC612_07310 [Bdellovibrionales bacterium]|jgi:hypothetical protein
MITSVALNRITDFLPALNFGKLWSSLGVKKPSRPATAQQRANRFHWVTVDGKTPVRPDDLMGYVYVTPDNKAIYWDDMGDKGASNARYIQTTPEKLFSGKKDTPATYEATRDRGDVISFEDRKQLLSDYYGDQKGMAFLANTLG